MSSKEDEITKELAENLFPEGGLSGNQTLESEEKVVIKIPGAIVHLIEKEKSVELAYGELAIVTLIQGNNTVAVFARIGDEIQWPLAKDEAVVKLDRSHYFFTLQIPGENGIEVLNYGLTIAGKGTGQEILLKEFDEILERYGCFSVKEVNGTVNWGLLDAREVSPEEFESEEEKRELLVGSSIAYWTTLAPNVDDYSTCVARMIAGGSGQLIKGILWCADVTVDSLNWGSHFLKKRITTGPESEIHPATLARIERVKKLTKMSEDVATGILSGVIKVSGFFTASLVNSKAGKKFFNLLPGEIVLASLDGFGKVCDAVEVAGRNVLSTTSTVTTGLVSQRYGEQASHATNQGFDAAGHAFGTAWAVLKIRNALNPKSVIKPTTLAKAAAKANSDSKIK